MKKSMLSLILVLSGTHIYACVTCNREIQKGIFNSTFYPNLLTMLSAFIVLGLIVGIFTRLATARYNARARTYPELGELASVPLTSAAIVTGIGIGSFVDGILLH